MDPDNATALSIRRWLLLSGWLEICVGLGHNVLGSLIIVRPTLVTPVVAAMGLPMSLLTPIVPPEQNALVLALSLLAGSAWILFGAILVWQARTRAAHPNVPLLAIVPSRGLWCWSFTVALAYHVMPAWAAASI